MTTEHIPTGVADTAAAHIVRHVASTHTAEELTVVWSTHTTLCPDWSIGHDQTCLAADWHPEVFDVTGLGDWQLIDSMQCGCGLRYGPMTMMVTGHVDPAPLAAEIRDEVGSTRDAQLAALVADLRAAIAATPEDDELGDLDQAQPGEVVRWDGDLTAWGVLPATGERVDVLADGTIVVDEIEMVMAQLATVGYRTKTHRGAWCEVVTRQSPDGPYYEVRRLTTNSSTKLSDHSSASVAINRAEEALGEWATETGRL